MTADHWCWRGAPVEPGAAVVFDIDGVLADADHRQHLLQPKPGGRKDWKTFFAQAGDDAVIEEVARLTELLAPDLCHVLLTARPTTIQDVTVRWLKRHDLKWDL